LLHSGVSLDRERCLGACAAGCLYDRAMTASERIVRHFYDPFNAGDVDGAAEQYAEDCEWDFPAFGAVCRTRQEVLDVCRGWKAAFPDGRVEVINAIRLR
jgi:ketosteroid isomerase-like protein